MVHAQDCGLPAGPVRQYSDSLLDCPLPQCVHDSDRQEAQRLAALERAREKVRLIQEKGWTVPEAARHFGVTRRAIFRLLQKAREAE